MQEQKARFILLRKIRYAEADLIVHALSAKGGKYSFIARSALKSKKRFGGGVLEPGNYVEFSFQVKSEGSMFVLTEAKIIEDFQGIKKSFEQVEFMLKVLELTGKIAQEGDENSEFLFNLVGHCLRAIEKASVESLPIVKLAFYLKLMYQQGVLEFEPWMRPLLKSELKSILDIQDSVVTELVHLEAIEQMAEHYAENAGV